MSDLRELYQQVILDHNKSPRNYGKMENQMHLLMVIILFVVIQLIYLKIENSIITDVMFEGEGCAICTSS